MPLTRARSIEALYDAVADYDRVVTPDAPLTLALNRRVEQPRLGRFAVTPRMLASGDHRPDDERQCFLACVAETDLDWKGAAHAISEICSCWDATGERDAILAYDEFDTPAIRTALDVVAEQDTARSAIAEGRVPDGEHVAVVGEDRLTALDRQVLPEEYDTIAEFDDASVEVPEFHVFDSASSVVDALRRNVSPEDAEHVACVMQRGSRYPPLVEAAFEADDVPYHGGPGFADDDGIRTFLRLLRTATGGDGHRVGECRPLLARIGVDPDVALDEQRLAGVDHPGLAQVTAFFDAIGEHTFEDALGRFEDWSESDLSHLRSELVELGLAAERVTTDAVDRLAFYLQTFDPPVDREDGGVLLADAGSAATVDRPVVFFLGVDSEWTQEVPDRPWIDAAERDRQHVDRFQLLLQSGQERYALVQDTVRGERVAPCLYFDDLVEEPHDSFRDFPHVEHTLVPGRGGSTPGPGNPASPGFERQQTAIEPETESTISQSTLNRLVNCPRDVFFDRLVAEPDRDYFRKGSLLHDFAEFYAAHPDAVRVGDGAGGSARDSAAGSTSDGSGGSASDGPIGDSGTDVSSQNPPVTADAIVDLICEELDPFCEDYERPALRTELALGIEAIAQFLDDQPPATPADWDHPYRSLPYPNELAERFGRAVEGAPTEQWFDDPDLGGKGMIDLLRRPDHLLDYKTGRRKSAKSVIDRAAIEDVHDTPNFQAPLYLTKHRRHYDEGPIEFTFFHCLDQVDAAVTGEPDHDEALVTVTYYPTSFADFAPRREAFDDLCAGVSESNDRRKTLERMGYDAYRDFFEANPFPDVRDRDAILETDFADRWVAHGQAAVGEYKYVASGCRGALKQLVDYRGENFFREDLDRFEEFLTTQREHLAAYRRGRFPVGDPNWDRVDHRDLILADEAAGEPAETAEPTADPAPTATEGDR